MQVRTGMCAYIKYNIKNSYIVGKCVALTSGGLEFTCLDIVQISRYPIYIYFKTTFGSGSEWMQIFVRQYLTHVKK